LWVKELCNCERSQRKKLFSVPFKDRGADDVVHVDVDDVVHVDADVNGGVDVVVSTDGGADALVASRCIATGMVKRFVDLSYSPDVIADFILFLTPLSFPDDNDMGIALYSLVDDESNIL
jgi:hypothetical protein